MDNQENVQPQQPEQEVYVPRPKWQVWGARVALVVVIVAVILYCITIARGGV